MDNNLGKRAQKNPCFFPGAQISATGHNNLMIAELRQMGETTALSLTDMANPRTIASNSGKVLWKDLQGKLLLNRKDGPRLASLAASS